MADRPDIVDIDICDLVGELKVDINSRIIPDVDFRNYPPVICTTYFMKSELILQIVLRYSARTDMIEAYLDVLAGPRENLSFKIKYGFWPFQRRHTNPQLFIYTTTNRRSERFPVCPFSDLLDFLVDNETSMRFEHAEFVSSIIISPRDRRSAVAQYRIPTVNDCDCDHKLICEGREIRVHRKILMGASKFFYRRLSADPLCMVTIIDALDKPKRLEKEVLSCVLRFMYGLNISDHNLQTSSLLCAAREYEVNTLFNICCTVMVKQLSESMSAELFYIGKTERAPRLAFEAAKYILKNYMEVRKTFEWGACIQAFPKFFEPIVPNPRKFFRGIIFPEVRSRSAGDMWSGASFLLRPPEITLSRPLHELKSQPVTETSSIAGSRCSQNTSMMSCDSLDADFEPMPRKRSSPVVSRRRSEGVFRMRSLDEALPKPRFSREVILKKLLANETQFEEDFGPIESATSSSRSLSRSLSLTDDSDCKSDPPKYDVDCKQPSIDEAMDCREDSNLTSSKTDSKPPDSMGPGSLSGERPNLSTPSYSSMPTLEFGRTYSYSSDSVFEHRETPKSMSKVLTPAEDMSVSEIPSRHQFTSVSPTAMKRIDFGMYTHPEARTLSDISSIPLDTSSSVEPESSSTSRSRSRREKRMKKMADKTRKFLPSSSSTNLPYDFSSSESSGIIPRPTFSKEPLKEKKQPPRKSQQKKDPSKQTATSSEQSSESSSESSSSSSSYEKLQQKKVSFGTANVIQVPFGEDVDPEFLQYLELLLEGDETRNYQNWIDSAYFQNDPGVSRSEDAEKAWDEKDEDELTAPLLQKIGASSLMDHKKLKKESTTSSSDTTSRELPIGGGVIRKARGRFTMASVDDPTPFSSSESVGTTSSSLSSTEHKKIKRKFTDRFDCDVKTKSMDQPTIERGQSFYDIRTIRRSKGSSQQPHNTPTLMGLSSIGLQEGVPNEPNIEVNITHQPVEETNIEVGVPQQPVEETNIEMTILPVEDPNIEVGVPQHHVQEPNIEIGITAVEESNVEIDITQQPVEEPIIEMFAEIESEKDEKQKSYDENIELAADNQKL